MAGEYSHFIATRIKQGDTDAFRTLFRMHYPSLVCFVERFVKDKDIAEDIVQSIFIKVWIYRSNLDETKPLRNYLFLLCRREVCNWFRREVVVQRFLSGMDTEEINESLYGGNIIDDLELKDLKRISDEIVNNMPDKRREVFILSRKAGLSIDEIAERLNISPRTVNKHLELALRTLRTHLNTKQL